LTPEREKDWKKWISLYKERMLSTGEYLGELYDIGYDIPETHVIRKADTLFYAFYSGKWQGTLKLKGLDNFTYRIFDYVNNRDLGIIKPDNPALEIMFNDYLLILAFPDKTLK
jgi:alpha-galactosidase